MIPWAEGPSVGGGLPLPKVRDIVLVNAGGAVVVVEAICAIAETSERA